MKSVFLALGTAMVILPSLSEARVQAGAIYWSASGGPTGPNVNPDNGGLVIHSHDLSDGIIGFDPGRKTNGANSGSVVLTTLYAFTNSSINRFFGGPSSNYVLSLVLRDSASGASGSLTFRGNLSGFINAGGMGTTDLTNAFLGSSTQTLTLGKNLYTVTIGPFVSPGPPLPNSPSGSISASIAAQPAVKTASNPEPSSLVLACLGLPSLGVARWFRRRSRNAGKP